APRDSAGTPVRCAVERRRALPRLKAGSCARLIMKTGNRLALTVCVALAAAWVSMPASAQGLAAQSARINALGDAGKYAEAIPLAQAMVANLEKSPASRDYAGAL